MADIIKIKARVLTGAPSSLEEKELAYGFADDVLYIGAPGSTIRLIAGEGVFAKKASPTFTGLLTAATLKITGGSPGSGKVLTSDADGDATWETPTSGVTDHTLLTNIGTNTHAQIDTHIANTTNAHGIDTKAPLASPALTGTPTAPTAATDTNTTQVATTAYVVGQGYAKLANPALTGTPTAPTAAAATNTTQISTTAFVQSAIAALVDSSPSTLNTLNELAAALGDDPDFATTITTSLGLKMVKTANLSDVADAGTSRTNLGLGTMATQNANAVAITGGTIDGVTIDGGTF